MWRPARSSQSYTVNSPETQQEWATVLFDTLFGNPEKTANSLARGLREKGIEDDWVNINAVKIEDLSGYDLLAVGAPTRGFTAAKPMKDFLSRLETGNLMASSATPSTRESTTVFPEARQDTSKRSWKRGASGWSGRAHRRSSREGGPRTTLVTSLKRGMEERFEATSREVGDALERGIGSCACLKGDISRND